MSDYADNLLRGLAVDDWVSDGLVTAAAFQIKFEEPSLRNGHAAQSISWEDDGSVVTLMLRQKKKDTPQFQFRAGVARLPREEVHRIMRLPAFSGILSYDREPLPDNPYHGNLLVSPQSNRTQQKLLSAVIAAHVLDFIPRSQNEQEQGAGEKPRGQDG